MSQLRFLVGKDEFLKAGLVREESQKKTQTSSKGLKSRAVSLNHQSLPKLLHGLVSRWVSCSNSLNFIASQNYNWVGLEGP